MGRSGMAANERGREEPQRDRARRDRRRRLPRRQSQAAARRTWTATACAASVIYGPLSLGFPIDDPALQERVLRGVERLGGRGVQRGRPRSAVRARVPARPLARGRGGRARAVRGARPPRRDHRRVRHRPRRPGLGPAVGGGGATGLPISFHIKGGTSSKLSYQIGKWQSAAFATRPAAAARRAARDHDVLRRARAASRLHARARGVGRRLAAVLPDADGPGVAARLRDKLDYAPSIAPSELFRRQVIATFEEEPLAAQLIPLLGADSCMWASDYPHTDSTFPRLAARDRRDARRARRRRTSARSPRRTARGCTASRMS